MPQTIDGAGVFEPPAALAYRIHHRAAGGRGAGKNHPALCGLGMPILCKASRPPAQGLGPDRIEAFLAETAQRPGVSNWQVQQARDALEL